MANQKNIKNAKIKQTISHDNTSKGCHHNNNGKSSNLHENSYKNTYKNNNIIMTMKIT